MKTLKFLLILTFAAFISCSEDEENNTKSEIVGTWQVTSYETRQGSGNWQDAGQACRLDDTEEYESNGQWTKYDGTNQCASGTGITTGTWKLEANDTKVVYTYDGVPGEYESTVELLSEGSLIVSFSTGDVANTQYRVTYVKN